MDSVPKGDVEAIAVANVEPLEVIKVPLTGVIKLLWLCRRLPPRLSSNRCLNHPLTNLGCGAITVAILAISLGSAQSLCSPNIISSSNDWLGSSA